MSIKLSEWAKENKPLPPTSLESEVYLIHWRKQIERWRFMSSVLLIAEPDVINFYLCEELIREAKLPVVEYNVNGFTIVCQNDLSINNNDVQLSVLAERDICIREYDYLLGDVYLCPKYFRGIPRRWIFQEYDPYCRNFSAVTDFLGLLALLVQLQKIS